MIRHRIHSPLAPALSRGELRVDGQSFGTSENERAVGEAEMPVLHEVDNDTAFQACRPPV
jgi:hypothetical protein